VSPQETEDGGRDWNSTATAKKCLENKELEEQGMDSFLEPLEDIEPCKSLDFRLLLQNYRKMYFSCFMLPKCVVLV
jgi:hypothetical protein